MMVARSSECLRLLGFAALQLLVVINTAAALGVMQVPSVTMNGGVELPMMILGDGISWGRSAILAIAFALGGQGLARRVPVPCACSCSKQTFRSC